MTSLYTVLSRNKYFPKNTHTTKLTKRHEIYRILIQRITLVIVFLFQFDAASEEVRDFKHDDHPESTGWTFWLTADPAYVCIGVAEVTPETLCIRRIDDQSLEQPHVGRACSIMDRRVSNVILDVLRRRGSAKHAHMGKVSAHISLQCAKQCPQLDRCDCLNIIGTLNSIYI